MRKLLLPLMLLVMAVVTAQSSQTFNEVTQQQKDRSVNMWKTRSANMDITVFLNHTDRTMTITPSVVNIEEQGFNKFIQVVLFENPEGFYTASGLYVDKEGNTYPVVAHIFNESFSINFGEIIFVLYKKEYSDKL